MATADEYVRLYGGCPSRVLAFSHLYAAFEGFGAESPLSVWWERELPDALAQADLPSATDKAAKLSAHLERETGRFSCVHLSEVI